MAFEDYMPDLRKSILNNFYNDTANTGKSDQMFPQGPADYFGATGSLNGNGGVRQALFLNHLLRSQQPPPEAPKPAGPDPQIGKDFLASARSVFTNPNSYDAYWNAKPEIFGTEDPKAVYDFIANNHLNSLRSLTTLGNKDAAGGRVTQKTVNYLTPGMNTLQALIDQYKDKFK